MKKVACFVLCLLLIAPSAWAESSPRKLSPEEPLYTSLYERSMELAGLFNEALHSQGYIALFPATDFGETLRQLQAQDFTQPWDVTIVRADHAAQDLVGAALAEADLSLALEEFISQGAYHAAANFLNAKEGTDILALSSLFAFSDAYITPEEMDGPCFAVAQYGGLYAFLVTFYPTVNGTMTVQARFIPSRAADALNLPAEQPQ